MGITAFWPLMDAKLVTGGRFSGVKGLLAGITPAFAG